MEGQGISNEAGHSSLCRARESEDSLHNTCTRGHWRLNVNSSRPRGGATDPAPGMSNGGSGGLDGTKGPATGTGVADAAPGKTDLSKPLISSKSLRNDAVVSWRT